MFFATSPERAAEKGWTDAEKLQVGSEIADALDDYDEVLQKPEYQRVLRWSGDEGLARHAQGVRLRGEEGVGEPARGRQRGEGRLGGHEHRGRLGQGGHAQARHQDSRHRRGRRDGVRRRPALHDHPRGPPHARLEQRVRLRQRGRATPTTPTSGGWPGRGRTRSSTRWSAGSPTRPTRGWRARCVPCSGTTCSTSGRRRRLAGHLRTPGEAAGGLQHRGPGRAGERTRRWRATATVPKKIAYLESKNLLDVSGVAMYASGSRPASARTPDRRHMLVLGVDGRARVLESRSSRRSRQWESWTCTTSCATLRACGRPTPGGSHGRRDKADSDGGRGAAGRAAEAVHGQAWDSARSLTT